MRADALKRRISIIVAATTLFQEKGKGVTLEAIAQKAGVGIATLYRNFPDKNSLIVACSIFWGEKFLDFQKQHIAQMTAENAEAALHHYVNTLLDTGLNTLLPAFAPHDLENIAPELKALRDQLIFNGEHFIKLAKKYGQVGPGVTHWQFITGLLALSRPRTIHVEAYEPNLTGAMIELYLTGIKAGHTSSTDSAYS